MKRPDDGDVFTQEQIAEMLSIKPEDVTNQIIMNYSCPIGWWFYPKKDGTWGFMYDP